MVCTTDGMAQRIVLSYTRILPTSNQGHILETNKDTARNSHCKNWPRNSTNGVTTVWIPVWHCSDHSRHSVLTCRNLSLLPKTICRDNTVARESIKSWWQNLPILTLKWSIHKNDFLSGSSFQWDSVRQMFTTCNHYIPGLKSSCRRCLGINTIIFVVLFN